MTETISQPKMTSPCENKLLRSVYMQFLVARIPDTVVQPRGGVVAVCTKRSNLQRKQKLTQYIDLVVLEPPWQFVGEYTVLDDVIVL